MLGWSQTGVGSPGVTVGRPLCLWVLGAGVVAFLRRPVVCCSYAEKIWKSNQVIRFPLITFSDGTVVTHDWYLYLKCSLQTVQTFGSFLCFSPERTDPPG